MLCHAKYKTGFFLTFRNTLDSTAVYYLIFNGILTVLLGRLEKKLEYFR